MPALPSISDTSNPNLSIDLPILRGVVLLRIACPKGASRAQIVHDLSPYVSHKLSPAEWRARADDEATALLETGYAKQSRNKLITTSHGYEAVQVFVGANVPQNVTWQDIQTGLLTAKALGITKPSPAMLKSLERPEGLRANILKQAYAINMRGTATVSRLRARLALIALERAFGNKIKTGLGAGRGFSAKAGRLLAGQLSSRPREFHTDTQLISALAAEAVDARQIDPEELRIAAIKKFISQGLSTSTNADTTPSILKAANDEGLPGAGPQAVRRPDPVEFANHVLTAAGTCADGWPGNRKALISKVWQIIKKQHPGWALSEIEFKCMLAEAHRAGLIALATADLKDKAIAKDLEASAITYKNTVWHFIRVVETG